MPEAVTITSETIYVNGKWIVRANSLSPTITRHVLKMNPQDMNRVEMQHKLSDGSERWFDMRTGEEIKKRVERRGDE